MANLRKDLGRRVRELRKLQHLTQEEIGERAGLHWTFVGSVERGERNVSLDSLEKLAGGLQVTVAQLFGGGDLPEAHRHLLDLVSKLDQTDADALMEIVDRMVAWKTSSE